MAANALCELATLCCHHVNPTLTLTTVTAASTSPACVPSDLQRHPIRNMMLAYGASNRPLLPLARRTGCCRKLTAQRGRPFIRCLNEETSYSSPPKYTSPGDYNILRTGSEPRPPENSEPNASAPAS